MRILVAEDETVTRFALADVLGEWGYDVVPVADGAAAWDVLRQNDAPSMAVLDWELPGMTGPEVCRRVRELPHDAFPYLLLLTRRTAPDDLLVGLRSGANDFLSKPIREEELAARLNVASQMVSLQQQLAERVAELEQERARVKMLSGLLPMCAWCRRIRNDNNYWQQVEDYLTAHTDVQITHGMCPSCFAHQSTVNDVVTRPSAPEPLS